MGHPPRASLVHALLTLCDDAFFAVAAAGRLDGDVLRGLGKRRAAALQAVARGAMPEHAGQGEAWLARLCAAIAPIAPPRWMAMADAVEEGLSLEHGARGLRGLFTSKPSEKEAARVRALGGFAARAVGAVLKGSREAAQLQRACLVASLGLPDEAQKALLAEEAPEVEALSTPEGMTPKLAKALLRGAFTAAALEDEGTSPHPGAPPDRPAAPPGPRAEQAALALGRRIGLPPEEVTAAHGEARRAVDAGRALGAVAVEAIRRVLADDPASGEALVATAARLLLPASARAEALAGSAPGRRYALDRKQREAALALAWAAAMRSDPTEARRVELAVRHEAAAKELGDEEAGREARREIEGVLDEELRALVPLVPG